MDQSGISKPLAHAQSSIRSFFQPRAPLYSAPPSSAASSEKPNGSISPGLPILQPTPTPSKPLNTSVSNNPPTVSIPPQASISTIYEKHVQPLKRINSLLLCINYPDSFYKTILDPHNSPNFSRVILWQDAQGSDPIVVGGMVCRLDRDEELKACHLYIQSLALLSPYRSYGLATALLESIITAIVSQQPLNDYPVASLYAHVWTENTDGLEWYTARGFHKEEPVVQSYYRKLKPDTAWVLRRILQPSDHLRNPSSKPQPAVAPRPEATLRAASYQKQRPDMEWNDLPAEMVQPSRSNTPNLLAPPAIDGSGPPSSDSSRSSSRNGLGKKRRQYPTRAFEAVGGSGSSA